MLQIFLQGPAVKREDLVIERRVQEGWKGVGGSTLGVPTAGTFNCHIVLDKLEQRVYAIKLFTKMQTVLNVLVGGCSHF